VRLYVKVLLDEQQKNRETLEGCLERLGILSPTQVEDLQSEYRKATAVAS